MHAWVGLPYVLFGLGAIYLHSQQASAVDPSSKQQQSHVRDNGLKDPPGSSCSVVRQREDCGYLGIQQDECEERSCCWRPVSGSNTPWCYYPQEPSGPTYSVTQRTEADDQRISHLLLELLQPVLPRYGPDYNQLSVIVEAQTPQRLHVKISPADDSYRWEVPEFLVTRPGSIVFEPSEALYSVQLPNQGQPFGFVVNRNGQQQQRSSIWQQAPQHGADGTLGSIFDTAGTYVVFKKQYMEIRTSISATTDIYGIGETTQRSGHLKLPRQGKVVTLWNHDIGCDNTDVNLYGSHPFYLQVDADGAASGVFLLNSNGMDIELQETSITYRVIGGVLDFYFFLGPTPESVIQQYQEVIGKPAMPPLWTLGFHQSRWGYRTLADVQQVVKSYKAANIPLEVMWADIDYMDRYRDFTFDPDRFNQYELKSFVDRLHDQGQRWVPITDCGIPHAPDDPAFNSGMELDVFIKDVTGAPFVGQVWPGATHYPDFLSVNRTWKWWKQQLQHMWDKVPYDGIWIDMNEASNFCDGEVCKLQPPEQQDRNAVGVTNPTRSSTSSSYMTPDPAGGFVQPSSAGGSWLLHAARKAIDDLGHTLHVVTRGYWPNKPDGNTTTPTQQHVATSASSANCLLDCRPPAATDTLSFPPYAINNIGGHLHLGSRTLPVSARHLSGELEYDAHNLYGLSEAAATRAAVEQITGKRAFVLSRSTFPGSGYHTAHWTGDNAATWDDLLWSISGLLNSNLWGIPLAGSDICGFQGNTTEELCARWIQAGAFYTFSRNHNSINSSPQELYLWSTVAEVARRALSMRYSLLPYLYTCFYKAHVDGGTVARPLFFAFPEDKQARDTFKQWMLGGSVLISPVLTANTTQLTAYFPDASWYNIWNQAYTHIRGPTTATMHVPLADTLVHVRGGSIVPLQQPGYTTSEVTKSGVKLLVALDQRQASSAASDECRHSNNGSDCNEQYLHPSGTLRAGVQLGCGMLYLDDGESLQTPPVQQDEWLLLLFSSMAMQSGLHGWLMSMPAAFLALKQKDDLLAGQQRYCTQQNIWPNGLDVLSAGSGIQSNPMADGAQAVEDLRARLHSATAEERAWPELSEIVVLGVNRPLGPETAASSANSAGTSAAELRSSSGFNVLVNGQQLADEQVLYDQQRSVLTITDLHLKLEDEFRMEWHGGAAAA